MTFCDVSYERHGPGATITLSRPAQLNALTSRMIEELEAALTTAETDEEVRCIVYTGAGRAFCAGADLTFVNAMPIEQRTSATAEFLAQASSLMARIEACPKPVIASVNGVATAGGMELILCCDLVIAANSARLGDGHANYGLLPGAGSSFRLPRRLGASHAKRLFFTGDLLSVSDPAFAQLVNAVVPDDELSHRTQEIVASIATKSPLVLSILKSLANAAADITIEEAMDRELQANTRYVSSSDRNEGLAAFMERRTPVFVGR